MLRRLIADPPLSRPPPFLHPFISLRPSPAPASSVHRYLDPLTLNPGHWSDDEDIPEPVTAGAAAVGFDDDDEEEAGGDWGFGDDVPPTPPSRPSLARVKANAGSAAPEPPPRRSSDGVSVYPVAAPAPASVPPPTPPARPRPDGKPLFESKFLPAYVHEKMSRKDAELLFITGRKKTTVGQFMVRQSESHEDQYTLCVMNVGNTITNMRLQTNDRDRIAIPIAAVRGGPFFRTIEGLVGYYQKKRVPSLRAEGGAPFFLTNPILKDKRAATVRRLLNEDRANKHIVSDEMIVEEVEDENGDDPFPGASAAAAAEGVYRSVADLEQERRASTLVYATPESLQEAASAQADAAKPPPPPRPSLSMESVQPKKRLYKAAELSSRVLMEILGKRGVDIPVNANRKELVVLVEAHGGVTASVRPKKR